MSCLRDRIVEAEEKLAFLEYMVTINDDAERVSLVQQLQDATIQVHILNAELLERQLEGVE